MGKIKLDGEELKTIQASVSSLQSKISEISNGGYVTDNLFSESTGDSKENMNEMLQSLVDSGMQMSQIITATSQYLSEVVEGFEVEDQEIGASFNLNAPSLLDQASEDAHART